MRTIALLSILVVVPRNVLSQDTLRSHADDVIETIIEELSDEQDLLSLTEDLEYLKQHPVNISTAQYGDLLQIPFFSPMIAEALLLMRDSVTIFSVNQLLRIPLMTPELYEKILPFIIAVEPVSVPPPLDLLPRSISARSRLEQRLQTQQGYKNGKYFGESYSGYQRIRVNNAHMETAGLFEKNAGELYSDGFIAGYLTFHEIGVMKKTLIGNFNLSSSQGLVFAKNISVTKGNNVINQIKIRTSGISPTLSTDEYRYFQGVASQFFVEGVSLTGFISRRDLHATIDANGQVSSFFTSGQFRTINDLVRRNRVRKYAAGGIAEFSIDRSTSLSLNLLHLSYDRTLRPSLYDLSGKKGINAGSVSVRTAFSTSELIAEIATNNGESFSKIFGIIFPLSRHIAMSFHHRAYTKGYVNPIARPFGERENISDGESGNYIGLRLKQDRFEIQSYADLFSLPSTTTHFGTTGRDLFTSVSFPLAKKFTVTAQIRNKTRHKNFVRMADDERSQTNLRIGYLYAIDRQWSFGQRIENVMLSYRPSGFTEHGFLTFSEGRFRSRKNGFALKVRVIFFDTYSYDSRLYQYESDVAGNYSNPPLYGKGFRWYVVSSHSIFNGFQVSLKYSETKKMNVAVMGSGDDQISGNFDNYIALQLDFKF